jgi:raffinose/stachyose/melibiose transport system permease protein
VTGRIDRALNYAILIFFSAIALYPIVTMLFIALHRPEDSISGFGFPAHIDFHNFADAWKTGHFSVYLRSSAIVSTSVVIVSTALSILAGYAFGTMRFRGSSVLFYVLLMGLILPYEAVIIPLYYDERAVGLVDTYLGLILAEIGLALPFGIFWMRAFFLSTPRSLIEAARLDGASTWAILWRILLPFGRPAVLTLVVLLFMSTWNEFLLALVLISNQNLNTAPLGLSSFQDQYTIDPTGLAAAAVIIALPIMLVYIFLQRHFIRGMLSGALKG